MAVLALLVVIGTTIVVVRLFRNGAREAQAGTTPAAKAPTVAESRVPGRRRRPPVATQAIASPSVGERWPGGGCPACGNEVPAGAKFCGECGNRLTA
jgi:hypothetical protein